MVAYKTIAGCLGFILISGTQLFSQTIKVGPYLQDVGPHEVSILWETNLGEEATVEWGESEVLGNVSSGTSQISNGTSQIHTVTLTGLARFSTYYYRVQTGVAQSDIHSFKTAPFSSDLESFRIIAMSDMQQDGAHPDKFEEIIHDGVMAYLESEGELTDNIALVMIPGDLVDNGNEYDSWEETFFDPAHDLFSQVPVYPVPGNHENNSQYFFKYFKLPNNGGLGYEEHAWHKDYGNVRLVGLDSNSPYDNPLQLLWLDEVLLETCSTDSINFVFAELHHPHKSELWTPGESDFTGEVIERLEQFSSDCNKPSIHFFGHTHGYSRGQSRDHKHLWINVATAGGAIDNWGEFPNYDYDEFSVSDDAYGFVSVEVSAGADPSVTVKRISRGDQDVVIDNILVDSLTFRLNPSMVDQPEPILPVDISLPPECVVLEASPFGAPDNTALHGQSHWQVASSFDGFEQPVFESWKNFENWYDEVDTQSEDQLWDEPVTGLMPNNDYWWRVRYRDRELNWSDWSEVVNFSTTQAMVEPNLLLNSGAENELAGWTVQQGVVEVLTAGECDGTSPQSGDYYFAVGGLCEHSEVGICTQDLDLSIHADSIDGGAFAMNFGAYLSDFGGQDIPEIRLLFLDENNLELGESSSLSSTSTSWESVSESLTLPMLTRTVRVELKGTRVAGTDNDSYLDEVYLRYGSGAVDCDEAIGLADFAIAQLDLHPNPASSVAYINLAERPSTELNLVLVDATGKKLSCDWRLTDQQISLATSTLARGLYTLWLYEADEVLGTAQLLLR